MTSSNYYTQCPDCKSSIVQDCNKGEYVCSGCGCVIMDQVEDHGPEAHFSDLEERSRNIRASGVTSISFHDFGLRTEIGPGVKDYSGKSINYQMLEQLNNMRRWQSRIRIGSPKERRLSNVLSKISETCSLLSLPKTVNETAAIIYRNFENKSEAKGKSISCMAAAAIYKACKQCGIVRSIDEIVNATGMALYNRSSIKLALKYYRMMVMELESEEKSNLSSRSALDSSSRNHNSPLNSHCIEQYISKLANMAKIDVRIERLAIEFALKTNHHTLADGKSPNGLAAAYIYIASILSGVNVLQRDVSCLAGVTEVTIRNRCKDILNCFKIELRLKPATRSPLKL